MYGKQQQAFVQPILYTLLPHLLYRFPMFLRWWAVASFPDDRLGMQIVPYLDLFQNPDVVPQGITWGERRIRRSRSGLLRWR